MFNHYRLQTSNLISLKHACEHRFSVQTTPYPGNGIFYTEEFNRPGFIDSIIQDYRMVNLKQEKLLPNKDESLRNLINEVNQISEAFRSRIDSLEARLVNQLTCFYTYVEKDQELHVLESEMKKCHEKIINSSVAKKMVS